MRFAIFGDIHANYHALEVILADAKAHRCSHHVCMGDIVGYNAFPKQCIDAVRRLECPVVKGNHDEQASMVGDQEGFNPLAEEAMNWTREQLSEEDKRVASLAPLSAPSARFHHRPCHAGHSPTSGATCSISSTRRQASTTSTRHCALSATRIPQKRMCATEASRILPLDVLALQPGKNTW